MNSTLAAKLARFDAFELYTVGLYPAPPGDDCQEIAEPIHDAAALAEHVKSGGRVEYSVFGHCVSGGVECLADFLKADKARELGARFAESRGVALHDFIV